jgi:DNA-binding FadR family transcriptional regulator
LSFIEKNGTDISWHRPRAERQSGVKSPYARFKTISYIRRGIAQGVFRPEQVLPAIRAMTKRLGVSRSTVWNALNLLAARKEIYRSESNGRYYTGSEAASPGDIDLAGPSPAAATGQPWQRVRTKLVSDIIGRRFEISLPLPSAKELCVRYRSSLDALRKALRTLADDEFIKRDKRWFRVYAPAAQPPRSRILVLTVRNSDGSLFLINALTLFRISSKHAARQAIRFDTPAMNYPISSDLKATLHQAIEH